MNNFKKITIGALLAASAGCLVAAAGCGGSEPVYYKLVFEGKGLDYVFQGELAPEDGQQFINGYEVQAGVEVRFTLALSASAIGTPTILLNGQELTPDEQGVYSFQISEDSTVQATGLQETKKVAFGVNEWYKFYDEDGKTMENELTVVKGESVRFKVWVSPYMKDEYYVTNGTEVLDPDDNGFYTIENVNSNTTVNVTGAKQGELVQDESFLERKDGTGTADDPYILERPIDLFTVAALVNSDFYTGFNNAYYKLNADIDMKGEKLFVIGDMSNGNAIFCGHFDGGGHTVKNFYITDEVINQETFEKAYLPFVGMFGYACATQASPVEIKNLTLENYEVTIHPDKYVVDDETSFAGSLVAYGIGVQIENCKAVNGKVTSENDYKAASIIGGLAGGLQSAYDTVSNTITYDAYVNGCSVDAQVSGSGFTVSAGGIAGFITSADTQAIAYISNCVTTGKVSAARDVGGIAGTLDRFSTVTNCYSSCEVAAKNDFTTTGAVPEQTRACAGGIVGYAGNDGVIYGCYAANTSVKATSRKGVGDHGAICGKANAAFADAADAAECLQINNREKVAGDTDGVFTDELGWTAEEWTFEGGVPAYTGAKARAVTITVKNGGKESSYVKQIATPVPVYAWYQDKMDEYIDDEDGRSWGYYFDEELTQKVPYGFVPTANVNLYYGYADYSQVAGTYYLGKSTYGIKAYFALDEKGGYSFRDGGMSFVGTYVYDGKKKEVTLYNSCMGAMEYTADRINGSYVTMVMNTENTEGGYELNGKLMVSDGSGSSLNDLKLTAVKKRGDFAYGEYVNDDGTLLLRPNGTAVHTVNDDVQQLTYKITASGIEFDNKLPVTVENGVITSFANLKLPAVLKDAFAGVWKPSAASSLEYSFDGRGGVKAGGVTGTYEVVGDKAVITVGGKQTEAVLNANSMNIDGTAYYLSDGFTGSWYGRSSVGNETVELTLGGVGANGYGEAQITFSSGITHSVEGQYSVTDDGVMIVYVGDTLYGEISINKTTGTAYGPFYSYSTYLKNHEIGYANAEFKAFDLFKGVWVCDLEGVGSINFTGKTGGARTAEALVSGTDGKTATTQYSLSSATAGTVTIGGKTYAMSLNENTNKIELSQGQTVVGGLAKRDLWYGVTLYEGSKSYVFDGNGNLSGSVRVSDGTTLQYTMGANGVPELDGKQLVAANGGFGWDGKLLTFKTGFNNSWLMPVTNEEVVIGEVNSDFTASVTIGSKDYSFVFNPEFNTLSCTEVDSKGVETVMTISAAGGNEITLTRKGATEETYICILSSMLDGWRGTFTAEDGATWVFDGHGLGEYGSGNATHTDANGVKTDYAYTQNELGMVFIHTGPKAGMVFKQVTLGGFKKQGDSEAYEPVNADFNYLVEARLNGIYYLFDGTGWMWKNEDDNFEKQYKYKILTSKCLVITDGNGFKKLASLNTLGGMADIKLSDYTEWTLKDSTKKYVFDIGEVENGKLKKGGLWLVNGVEYVREYTYSASTNGVYYLTDDDKKTYKMTLNQTDNTFILEEEKNETQN